MLYPRMLVALLLTVTVTACAEPDQDVFDDTQTAEELAPQDDAAMQREAEARLDQMRNGWVDAALANDPVTVAAMYTEDALFVGAGNQVMEGRQAIEEGLAEPFGMLTAMEATPVTQEVAAHMTSEMGTYSQTFQTDDGEMVVEGYYMIVSRRQDDGSWKIIHHIGASTPDPETM